MIDFLIFLILVYAVYVFGSRTKAKKTLKAHQPESKETLRKDELYYAGILQLSGQLTRDDIKKRYRELVSQYHPDKVTHLGMKLRVVANEEMKEINESYDFFKNRYDIN